MTRKLSWSARIEQKHQQLGHELDARQESPEQALGEAMDHDVGDDLLRLVFMTCHPALKTDAQVALTLRLLGGLTTPEIARAFLVPEATVAQRIVRAKRTLSEEKALSKYRVATRSPRGWRRCSGSST